MDRERTRVWIWLGAAAVVAVLAFRLSAGSPGPEASAAPPVALQESARDAGVWVHVAGAVRRPGLYRMRPEARVGQAVKRAGGPLRKAELSSVNLAARVEDGQQVLVPRRGQASTPTAGASAAGDAAAASAGAAASGGGMATLSLASATVEQLDALDGIGPTLAARIVEYRDQHGGVGSIDELGEVDGIGEARLEALRQGLQP
jgi:competence protein ComEA